MIKTLLACYNEKQSDDMREKFTADFVKSDKILLLANCLFSLIVAFVTSMQYGYYALGMIGGAIISIVCLMAYNMIAGTFMCRVIMATSLMSLMAISVQQSNGLGEGHFLFFLGFTILIRYKDIVPLFVFVLLTVVHHLSLTYCQSVGAELWDQPIILFSWGEGTGIGLFAPLVYHVVFAVISLIVSTYYIFEANKGFVESNLVIGAIENAAQGDLSQGIDGGDIKSEMITQVDEFLLRLQQIFSQINIVVAQLATQAAQTNQSAHSRAEQASSQQNEVAKVTTAVKEMATATHDIASNAEQTALASNDTVETSEAGGKIANTCQISITELAKHVEQASTIIAELDRDSQKISSIVQTISGIAEQTNLLALNAAIEAARAGEQGRGFAVVADEVRVLSQRTHSSTVEITTMISSLQSSTNSAVETMGGCHELATNGVNETEQATESFENIVVAIKHISDMATQIATAAEQQSSVINDINHTTDSISEVSAQFSLEAEQGIEQSVALEQEAKKLDEVVSYFSLKDK